MRNGFKVFLTLLFFTISMGSLSASADAFNKIKVGFFALPGYHEMDEDGNRSGYGYDYLQNMAKYNNWGYEYIGYKSGWNDMLSLLENGSIDVVTPVSKTKEREKKYDFSTQPIGYESVLITVSETQTKYLSNKYNEWDGIRIGVLKGSSQNKGLKSFAQKRHFTYQEVEYSNAEKMTADLQIGTKIDAIAMSNLRQLNNEVVIAQFDTTPFYAVVKKGRKKLLRELNLTINRVETYEPSLRTELMNKYYRSSTERIGFTAEERILLNQYRDSKQKLRAIFQPNHVVTTMDSNDKQESFVKEIADRIEKTTGVEFEYIKADSQIDYEKKIRSGEVDVILDSTKSYSEAENLGYKIGNPYLSLSYMVLTRKGHHPAETKIAAVRGEGVTRNYIEKKYAKKNITYYEQQSDAVDAVMNGLQDACIVDTYYADGVVYNDETNRMMMSALPYYTAKLFIGVKNNMDYRLLAILNKAVEGISESEKEKIISEKTAHSEKALSLQGQIYRYPYMVICATLALAAVIVLVVCLVFNMKRKRAAEKAARSNTRFLNYVCQVYHHVTEYDMLRNKRYRYFFENDIIQREEISCDTGYLMDCICENDRESCAEYCGRDALLQLVAEQKMVHFDAKIRNPEGKERWNSITLQGIAVDEEHPCNFMVFLLDIENGKRESDRQKQFLQDALSRAENASKAKGDFLAHMSHEIRTPLNAILGYMEIAERDKENSNYVFNCLEKSQMAAGQLRDIINDILDMSSIESGKMKLTSEKFSITKEVLGVVSLW